MSVPIVKKRQLIKCIASRLGSRFLARLDRGLVIDRTKQAITKNVKTVAAPKGRPQRNARA